MLVALTEIIIKQDKNEELFQKSQDLLLNSRLEKGCLRYELFSNAEFEGSFLMVENWENQEAFDKHMETKHFLEFIENISDILIKDIDVDVYELD